jgi:hypothetical protein
MLCLSCVSGGIARWAKGVLQSESLHPIGARADAGKKHRDMCGVMSGKRRLREDQMENSQN